MRAVSRDSHRLANNLHLGWRGILTIVLLGDGRTPVRSNADSNFRATVAIVRLARFDWVCRFCTVWVLPIRSQLIWNPGVYADDVRRGGKSRINYDVFAGVDIRDRHKYIITETGRFINQGSA